MRKYLPKSVDIVQGHLNQERKFSRLIEIPITMEPSNAETIILLATVADSGKFTHTKQVIFL